MRLYNKLFAIFLPLTVVSAACISYYSSQAVNAVLLDELESRVQTQLAEVLPAVREGLESGSERLLLPALQACRLELGALYAGALGPDGRVLAHTDAGQTGQRRSDPFTQLALVSRVSASARVLRAHGEPVLELTVPILAQEPVARRFGALRVALPLRETLATRRRIAVAVSTVLAIGGGLTLLVLFLFVRGMLESVAELAHAAESIGRGDYATRIEVSSSDEVGDLARRFNQMAGDLARTTVSKEFLAQVLRTTLDALLVTDAEGRITLANPATTALTGIEEPQLLGRDASSLFVGDLPEGPAQGVELGVRTSGGAVTPVLVSRAPMRQPGRGLTGWVYAAKDISDRKRAEETEALRERHRIQREFMATVSHELRTPITAIKGFAETLLAGGIDDVKNRVGFVKTIERNAARLAQLVENLLALSVLETGRRRLNPEPLDFSACAREFISTMEPLLRRSCQKLYLRLEPGLIVRADAHQLPQVLQNLIDNAIKFSPRGSTIEIASVTRGDEAVISVKDCGIGIAAEDLPRVFERFHRAEASESQDARRVRGTGLGLSIAKQIVEMHGGRMWVESVRGQGTTFHFTVPLARQPDALAA